MPKRASRLKCSGCGVELSVPAYWYSEPRFCADCARKRTMKTQLHIGTFNPKISPIKNRPDMKPQGGFWTSTYLPEDEFVSDWVRWCSNNQPKWIKDEEAKLIDISSKARIYTIDSYEDMMNLLKDYPFEHPCLTKTMQTAFAYIDWEKVSEKYDGVHLTRKGELATRIARTRGPCLVWDCESTLWFRNVFTKIVPYEGKLVP